MEFSALKHDPKSGYRFALIGQIFACADPAFAFDVGLLNSVSEQITERLVLFASAGQESATGCSIRHWLTRHSIRADLGDLVMRYSSERKRGATSSERRQHKGHQDKFIHNIKSLCVCFGLPYMRLGGSLCNAQKLDGQRSSSRGICKVGECIR
jgi:hypothetical protein